MAQSGKVAILKISAQANGSFAAVLRLAEEGKQPFLRTTHTLPAAPKLFQHYQQWQQSYYALGQTSRWRWHRIIVPNYQVLNASKQGDLKHLWERVQLQGDQVETELHQWFEQSSFRDLREDIIGEVRADEPLRLILETDDRTLQRLPWHRWPLLQKRPKAEFVLAAPYRAEKVEDLRSPLKILTILGLCDELDVTTDLKTLQEQFTEAQIKCLTNPSLDTLKDALFYGHCDVLLFSGHSQSCDAGDCVAGEMGRSSIFLGDLPVPIVELSAALTAAVCNGLKLAIFNSCDGLGLAQDVSAAKIPNVVVMREPIPDEAAQDFLRYFLQAFQLGNAFHLAVRHARERLRDESQKYPQAAWLPVIFQNPSAPSFRYQNRRRGTTLGLAAALIAALGGTALIGVNGWRSHQLNLRISGCENALVEQVTNLAKEQGIRACAQGQWSEAIAQFEAALQEERNDPETRIYINNARILASGSAYDTVVASIPIGSNLNVAQEMLRGVAQAQTEFNGQDNGSRKLRVLIANDDNDTVLAKRLARQFAKNKDILAVIGHNATNASMAGAEIYNARQLPMLTPTSFAGDLDMYDAGKKYPFAFRMVPNMLTVSQLLSAHIVKQGYQKVAVCVDNSAEDNASFGNDFKKVADDSFEILDIPCDLGMAGFSAEEAIAAILDAGADAMVLAPHIDRLEKGLALARSNSGQTKPLALYGSPSFYTQVTLEQGQSAVEGMVIPSLWNPDNLFKEHPFLLDANRLWGGPVNWRTAMSYDATQIIAQGLQRVGRSQHEGAITNLQFDPQAHATNSSTKHSNTKQLRRRALQQQLSESDFSHNGVTGFVQFRKPKPKERTIGLLKIHPTPDAETQYKFRLLPQKKD